MTRKTGKQQSGGGVNKAFYALIALVALGGVAWLVMAGQDGGGQTGNAPLPVQFAAVYDSVTADSTVGLTLGSSAAPVTLTEFADYQCPHCARFGTTGRLLRQNYVENGQVKWVLYDYVLGTFPNSVQASVAARCAGDQGNYWGMHDLLLSRQGQWGTSRNPEDQFGELAEQIGLDAGDLEDCMGEGRHLNEVAAARKYGDSRGVSSTPTIFLNGRRLNLQTEGSYQALEALIRQAIDSATAAASTTDEADGATSDTAETATSS